MFPLVSVLRSTDSAADCSTLFVGFVATTTESDFSRSCITGYYFSRLPSADLRCPSAGRTRDLPVPAEELPHMPEFPTTPGRASARGNAPARVAFRVVDRVGSRVNPVFAAQWLAYALPYRRFAVILADAGARLGVDVGRYSFIVMDFHYLLFAGFAGAPTI